MSDPVVNLEAEANLLAALLQEPEQVRQVLDILSPDDLWEPRAQTVLTTMAQMMSADIVPHPRLLSDELMRRGELARLSGDGWLGNLLTRDHVVAAQSGYYAGMVLRASRQRQIQAFATGIQQRVIESDADPDEILDFAEDTTRKLRSQIGVTEAPLPTIRQLAERDNTMRWVVPGLVAEHDRTILVGHEGHGKSLCVTQIAVCAAAGVNPFTLRPCPQTRVLVVDCENDADTVTERMDLLLGLALTDGSDPENYLTYVERPGGLELAKGSDATWLSRLVARVRPQMLVIGPLYRLTESDLAKDEASRGVIATLDRVRLRAGCALLMEAHVGNEGHDGSRPYRPYGASIWRRWAGVGLSLRPAQDLPKKEKVFRLAEYRGKRSRREWPEYLGWGKEGSWPWRALSAQQVKEIKLLVEAGA